MGLRPAKANEKPAGRRKHERRAKRRRGFSTLSLFAVGAATDDEKRFGYLLLESLAAFQKAIFANGAQVMADIPNYTNASPGLQISEVK